ncbi:energy transducer TonB [Nemorincola caseinilytica]|uniref:Energy transducer TonB n=1 Tax=Nemorincola caseinilytica TaxID=2054315 RepID=A0ABP8N810_9BACT
MEINALKNADYLDIIFDNRNKSYGGYQLRKSYGQRVGKAVAILYGALAAIILYGLLHKQDVQATTERILDGTILTDVYVAPPPVVVPPPPPPPRAVMPHARPTRLLTDPVVTDEPIPDDRHMAHASDLTHANVGRGNVIGEEGDITPDIRPGGSNTITPPADTRPDKPLTYVEQMPAFSGDLQAYLAAHINYPHAAREFGIGGRVIVSFVVNEDGKITDAHVVRGIGGGCDEEALRVVNSMPPWKPGRQNGRAVKVIFNLPVVFELQ